MIAHDRLVELAIRGMEIERERLNREFEALGVELAALRNGAKPKGTPQKRKPLSAEQRQTLSNAMKRHWKHRRIGK